MSFLEDFFLHYVSLYSLLFILYALGFTLISSCFHFRSLLERYDDDFKAAVRYFVYFSLFLFVVPFIGIIISSGRPLEMLRSFGLQPGNYKLGLIIMLVSLPVSYLSGFLVSRDPNLRQFYPYSKKACRNVKTFVVYESLYLILYYVAWEFTFRGVILFSIADMLNNSKAGVLIAILVQTIISTVYHLGHPETEIISSFFGGIIFGLIAYLTRSFLYTLFLHALIGIVNDTFLYVRYYRNKSSAR